MKKYFFLFSLFGFYAQLTGQILSIDPVFPTVDDTVTIIYDATQGNGALTGVAPVYAHTGVILASGGPNDWMHVQGNWGTADNHVLMENLGNNKHRIRYHIKSFYGVNTGEEVVKMAFVFRNANGSIVGRAADGSDIFTPVYSSGSELQMSVIHPADNNLLVTLDETIPILAYFSKEATISVHDNEQLIAQTTGDSIALDYTLTSAGNHDIIISATDGTDTVMQSFRFVINPEVELTALPPGVHAGVNRTDSSVILALYAPDKDFVYVLGDFNDYLVDADYFMKKTPNEIWWQEIQDLSPDTIYGYQFFVDGEVKIGDPYSEVVLDGWNDSYIDEATYPNLKPYPTGKTSGIVSTFETNPLSYGWEDEDFTPPDKTDLVIYELLIRDFTGGHNYRELLDTLGYLERLGVNAIELMPVSEFEGNLSWGYNPSYHGALDKYYGTKDALKDFVNEAHRRGIAVIMDVVFNHSFGQSPLAQLYWDNVNNRPAANNPWYNAVCPHQPWCWGNDFNHESLATQAFLDRTNSYWMTEYHIDGFRFDFTKGFTNTNGNGWAYDASRIAILKRMADAIWAVNPDAYVILEHLTDNSEEKVLAEYGMMLWGNMNYEYNEATMGYASNLSYVSYKQRGWSVPHLVGYMESHDEERLMYKNLRWGASSGDYDVKDLPTALERIELAACFFFTIPGPKMIWQFGEMGYDYSINTCQDGSIDDGCRVDPKPIRWDYLEDENRSKLFSVYRNLIHLKKEEPVFSTTDFNYELNDYQKQIHLNDTGNKVTVLGNFAVSPASINPHFQQTGWWYDYFSGDSIQVTNTNASISLAPGEYHLYSTKKMDVIDMITGVDNSGKVVGSNNINIFPNPANDHFTLKLSLKQPQSIEIDLLDISGRLVEKLYSQNKVNGVLEEDIDLGDLPEGLYFVRVISGGVISFEKLLVD